MTGRSVVRSPAAEDDLIDIWCQIAIDSPKAADRFLDRIVERISQLAVFPDSGVARPEIADDARSLTVGNYLVLYRHSADVIEIIRVVHGARELDAIL